MEQYSRTKKIIGEENLKLIQNTSVLIVGLGGVGGSCLETLVRSGINDFSIVDYDIFEESNLNRQILSSKDNIGMLKVDAACLRMKNINNDINIKCLNIKLDENLETILPMTDYIIDACDDTKVKVALVKYAIKNNIKIISSCGTGNRLKPELLKITNIWKTEYDPLAKKIRNMLRKENINYNLPVVSSFEIPIKTKDVVGSMPMVPNAAGILLASYVINDIINNN